MSRRGLSCLLPSPPRAGRTRQRFQERTIRPATRSAQSCGVGAAAQSAYLAATATAIRGCACVWRLSVLSGGSCPEGPHPARIAPRSKQIGRPGLTDGLTRQTGSAHDRWAGTSNGGAEGVARRNPLSGSRWGWARSASDGRKRTRPFKMRNPSPLCVCVRIRV